MLEDINIYFFSNKNANYKKSYTSYYVFKVILIGNHNFAKDNWFYLQNL